jgi:hypothetical protein
MSTGASQPLFPPLWFVERFNEQAFERTQPGDPWPQFRTGLDPLVLLAWHEASKPLPFPLIISGV